MGTPVVTNAGIPVVDKRSPRLTDAFIRAIKVPCKRGDGHGGHGLTFVVRDRAGGGLRRFWRQTVTIGGKKRSTGLGNFPIITLKVAREKAFDNARKIALGEDILGPAAPAPSIPSLGDVFDSFAATQYAATLHRGDRKAKKVEYMWNHSKWYCTPILSKSIADVTPDDVHSVLRPIWIPHRATGVSVQNHLNQILLWAIDMQYRTTNPANRRSIVRALGKQPPPKNYPAAKYTALGGYLAQIRDSKYGWASRYCLLFLAFTVDRTDEVIKSVWSDVDWDKETLTIPADRMKTKTEHVIPLSPPAMEILRLAWSKPLHSKGTIFPPPRGGLHLNDAALTYITGDMGLPFVPHGLRATFKTWVSDTHPDLEHLAEMSLSHVVGTATERAYRRTIVLEPRRELLKDYADFLIATSGSIISPKDR